MFISDKKVRTILEELMEFIVPRGMSPRQRAELARRAGLDPETLRTMARRKSVHADTLIRLLLARGVAPRSISLLPQTHEENMEESEMEWILFGQKLTSLERSEFLRLMEFLQRRWGLKKR